MKRAQERVRSSTTPEEYRLQVLESLERSACEILDVMTFGGTSNGSSRWHVTGWAEACPWRLKLEDTVEVAKHFGAITEIVQQATLLYRPKPLTQRVREARDDEALQTFLADVTGKKA